MAISKISSSSIDPNVSLGDGFFKVDSTNNRIGIGTSSPASSLSFPIGTTPVISQVAIAGSAHSADNVGSLGLAISDGGGYSGVFVHNTHDGTFSSQDIRFLTAKGGNSVATERMRIDSAGYVTKPNQPCILLNGNDPNNNAVSALEIEKRFSVDFNVGITWNATTGAVTVPVAGKYLWYMQAYDNGGSLGSRIQILHNGTNRLLSHFEPTDNSGTLNLSIILDMQANDYVQMQHVNAVTMYTGAAHQRIYGYLLG